MKRSSANRSAPKSKRVKSGKVSPAPTAAAPTAAAAPIAARITRQSTLVAAVRDHDDGVKLRPRHRTSFNSKPRRSTRKNAKKSRAPPAAVVTSAPERRRTNSRRDATPKSTKAARAASPASAKAVTALEKKQLARKNSLAYQLQWEATVFFFAEIAVIFFLLERITCRVVAQLEDRYPQTVPKDSHYAAMGSAIIAIVVTLVKTAFKLGSAGERVSVRRTGQSERFADELAALEAEAE